MAATTSSSNSFGSVSGGGRRARASLRTVMRSTSSSLGPSDPISITVSHAVTSTSAAAPTTSVIRSSAPESDGGLTRNRIAPTVNAAIAAALSGARSASCTPAPERSSPSPPAMGKA